ASRMTASSGSWRAAAASAESSSRSAWNTSRGRTSTASVRAHHSRSRSRVAATGVLTPLSLLAGRRQSSGPERPPLLGQPPEARELHRPGEEETLPLVALELAQHAQLGLVLDALGNGAQPERATEVDHRADELQALVVGAEVADEAAVDLDDVHRQAPDR